MGDFPRVPDEIKPYLEARPTYTSWLPPDRISKCEWHENQKKPAEEQQTSPHEHFDFDWERPKILNSTLEAIGRTPLVRLRKINLAEDLQCEVLGKCESFNTGGSVKDRIALRMIESAERSGKLKPGGTIIENTGGNTGIGLAYVALVKGYKCIIVMVDKISIEKEETLKALGAYVIRTNGKLKFTDPNSDFGVSQRLAEEIPNSCYIGQFQNLNNPLTHYDTTAEELLYQCDGKIDMFVASSGTGGTLTGVGRKLKEKLPNIKIVGADPIGSVVAFPDNLNSGTVGRRYEVEGMGRPFVPMTCDREKSVDQWIKVSDAEGFNMARRLIQEEGILAGGSSGFSMKAAIEAAKQLGPGQRCVVMLADGMRNYMSKFVNRQWMEEKGFITNESGA